MIEENKNRINQHKHAFHSEAKTVFYDEEALVITTWSIQNRRTDYHSRLWSRGHLFVVLSYRASDTVVRIISARKATKTESKYYGKWGLCCSKSVDFSNAREEPLRQGAEKQIINIDSNTIDYFKEQAEVVGIPYQTPDQFVLERLRCQ